MATKSKVRYDCSTPYGECNGEKMAQFEPGKTHSSVQGARSCMRRYWNAKGDRPINNTLWATPEGPMAIRRNKSNV